MNSTATPAGPGSVSGAPNLPAGFTDTFTSRYVDTGDLRLHAVVGGEGPPLLLVHGWPETWYAWRLVMPALARDFEVIAVDQRGIGLSDKPADGYDTGTLAADLVALMDALGHERFAVAGHDTGFAISYALAADHPDRVDRVALAEIPGPPGAAPSPPLFVPAPLNDRLWHLAFNRVENLPEQLIAGREAAFFGYEFAVQGGKLADEVVDYYVRILSEPDVLPGSLGFYRSLDTTLAQQQQRTTRLTMPVLAIGGAASYGDHVGEAMQLVADDVQSVVIPGHRPLGRRGGTRGDAGGADRVPGPVPRPAGRGARHRMSSLSALDGAPVWLNSDPLGAEGLRGRVVVVDFWTYSCVNWLRTLPYVSAWAERYRDDGLVVVGVHAPEFGFEHDLNNVRRAVSELSVGHPVVIDNDFAVWRSFDNHYWPALYLVDRDGRVRFHHFGEGAYEEIERAIQRLLDVDGEPVRVDGGRRRRGRRLGHAEIPGDLRGPRAERAPHRPARRRARAQPVDARRRVVGRRGGRRARGGSRLDRVQLPGTRPQPGPRAALGRPGPLRGTARRPAAGRRPRPRRRRVGRGHRLRAPDVPARP